METAPQGTYLKTAFIVPFLAFAEIVFLFKTHMFIYLFPWLWRYKICTPIFKMSQSIYNDLLSLRTSLLLRFLPLNNNLYFQTYCKHGQRVLT